MPALVYDAGRVLSLKKLLPRGPIKIDDEIVGERARTLVQVYTDPGGLRTVAVADIRLKDPGRAKK